MKNIPDSATERSACVPPEARHVLRKLIAAGHEAWYVGGCVRDILLGQTPRDWDVTTSATPEEVMEVFPRRTIPTGLRHGTVTVRSGRDGVEVTTYRLDGVYEDHRRPSSVSFTRSLEEDLRRRDFTINAMAMSLDGEIRDPFDGRADLREGILRCIGVPDERFTEDALRLMRGLRFSAALGFRLLPDVADAIHRNRRLLAEIAPERIQMELCKLLQGARATGILREYPEVFGVFWPELLEMRGFEQRNVHHCYDVWEHTLHAMDGVPPDDLILRLTMLLHDIGKPRTFSEDEQGQGHFRGHQAVSRDMAEEMLRRLHFPRVLREQVTLLVEWHDRPFVLTEKAMHRLLRRFGEEATRRLIAVKRADNLAQAEAYREERQQMLDGAEEILNRLIEQDACFSLRQLAVNGSDLLDMGLSGPRIGKTLDALLNSVVNEELPNNREALLRAARERNGLPVPKKRGRKRRKRSGWRKRRPSSARTAKNDNKTPKPSCNSRQDLI